MRQVYLVFYCPTAILGGLQGWRRALHPLPLFLSLDISNLHPSNDQYSQILQREDL